MMYTRRLCIDSGGRVQVSYSVSDGGQDTVITRQAFDKARRAGKPSRVMVVVPEDLLVITVGPGAGAPSSGAGRPGPRPGGEV